MAYDPSLAPRHLGGEEIVDDLPQIDPDVALAKVGELVDRLAAFDGEPWSSVKETLYGWMEQVGAELANPRHDLASTQLLRGRWRGLKDVLDIPSGIQQQIDTLRALSKEDEQG